MTQARSCVCAAYVGAYPLVAWQSSHLTSANHTPRRIPAEIGRGSRPSHLTLRWAQSLPARGGLLA